MANKLKTAGTMLPDNPPLNLHPKSLISYILIANMFRYQFLHITGF